MFFLSHRVPLIETSLYVHIPFCRHRCGYCAFAVTTKGHDDRAFHRQYIAALESELKRRLAWMKGIYRFRTLYIGGGTPSRLHPDDMALLFQSIQRHFPDHAWEEVTFELNPEDLAERPDYPAALQAQGVTRLSFGTQTVNPKGLQVLERQASPDSFSQQLLDIRSDFKGSISLDLILAWPGQQLQHLEEDLSFIRQAKPDHLSIYFLNLEKGTKLERDRRKGLVKVLDEDQSAALWDRLLLDMDDQGFEHYEISNFCRAGHASLHNTLTWRSQPYLGIGSGAVSRVGLARWTNVATAQLYLRALEQQKWPVASGEALHGEVYWQEMLLLGLRHREGLNLSAFRRCFKDPLPQAFWDSVQLAVDRGDVMNSSDTLKMGSQGWARFDAWVSDWMLILEDTPTV